MRPVFTRLSFVHDDNIDCVCAYDSQGRQVSLPYDPEITAAAQHELALRLWCHKYREFGAFHSATENRDEVVWAREADDERTVETWPIP